MSFIQLQMVLNSIKENVIVNDNSIYRLRYCLISYNKNKDVIISILS